MNRIKIRLLQVLERRFGLVRRRRIRSEILGRKHTIIEGSQRESEDYDDAWLFALAARSKFAIDVGCNIGQSTLVMLWPGTIERIVLIEANSEALSICAENLITNGLSAKAHFVRAFASSTSGKEIDFYTVGAGAAGSEFGRHAQTAKSLDSKVKVATVSLDDTVRASGVFPDLVKIDVEGSEASVLAGSREIAQRRITKFLVEMHSNPDLSMERNAERILAWCDECGFTAWYLKEKAPLTDPGALAHRGRCHLLLLPSNQPLPDYLLELEQGASLKKALRTIE